MIAFGIGLLYRGGGVGAANANRRANQTLPYIYTQSRCALCARACVVFIIGIERRERTHMFEEMEISQDTTSNLVFVRLRTLALGVGACACELCARCALRHTCAMRMRVAWSTYSYTQRFTRSVLHTVQLNYTLSAHIQASYDL